MGSLFPCAHIVLACVLGFYTEITMQVVPFRDEQKDFAVYFIGFGQIFARTWLASVERNSFCMILHFSPAVCGIQYLKLYFMSIK